MSRTIELPDDVYARVEEAASASGNSVAEVIAARFPELALPPSGMNGSNGPGVKGPGKPPRTMAELAEGLVGQVAGHGPRDLARNHSKYMSEYLEEEHRRTQP